MSQQMSGWPMPADPGTWMSDIDRRLTQQARRGASSAAGILGPGLGPHATLIADWNSETATFNGIFYSEVGAINGPDDTRRWMGFCRSTEGVDGVMDLTEFGEDVVDPIRYTRTFTTTVAGIRTYGPWVKTWPIGQWTSYSPTITGGSMGTLGILDGRYALAGNGSVDFEFRVAPGAGYVLDNNTVFGLPVGTASVPLGSYLNDITVRWLNAADNLYDGMALLWSTGVSVYAATSVTNGIVTQSGFPSYFNAGDLIYVKGSYVRA